MFSGRVLATDDPLVLVEFDPPAGHRWIEGSRPPVFVVFARELRATHWRLLSQGDRAVPAGSALLWHWRAGDDRDYVMRVGQGDLMIGQIVRPLEPGERDSYAPLEICPGEFVEACLRESVEPSR